MKKFVKIVCSSSLIGSFLYSYLFFSQNGKLPFNSESYADWLFVIGVSILTAFFVYHFNSFLIKVKYLRERNFIRILLSIIFNYTLIITFSLICFGFYSFAYTEYTFSEFYTIHASSAIKYYILIFVTIFLFVLIDFLIQSYQQFEQAKLTAIKLSREQSELQLDAFKMQLSPHFLFNNLNTLSFLIYKNPQETEHYIRNLSVTYNYILKNSQYDLVVLKDEIEFIKAYSYLLNIRFQDSLSISIAVENKLDEFFMPPLSLQLLVENAVKHNAANPESKLFVKIEQVNNSIRVKNNLLKSPENIQSSKLGLKNLKRRYSFFTQRNINIIVNDYYTVTVPLIK